MTSSRVGAAGAGEPRPAAGRYALFGQVLASAWDFETPLAPTAAPPDLLFAADERAPRAVDWGVARPLFSGRHGLDGEARGWSLVRLPEAEVMRFDGVADFYLGRDRIDAHLGEARHRHLVEPRLLGPVMAYWLERRRLLVFHAAAVTVAGRAVAFLAANRGGKTSLAAALMERGHPLLTDDLLAVDPEPPAPAARAGVPAMKMWGDAAARFLGRPAAGPVAGGPREKGWVAVGGGGFGRFWGGAGPLARIYLPERRPEGGPGGAVEVVPLAPGEAVIELVRGSYAPRLVEAAGLGEERLDRLVDLAGRVPVRRLAYDPGFDRLAEVCAALEADLGEAG